MMDSVFRPWSSRLLSPHVRRKRSSQGRVRAGTTPRGVESLEDRRLLAFQYSGVSWTNTTSTTEAYQWNFEVFNSSPENPATLFVRQNDAQDRWEFSENTSFSGLPQIDELGPTFGGSPPVVGPGYIVPGSVASRDTSRPTYYYYNDVIWNPPTREDFYLSRLRVTCAPGTINPTFYLQTNNTFRLAIEVDFSNAAPGSTGRVYVNAPLQDNGYPTTVPIKFLQGASYDYDTLSTKFITNEIYVNSQINARFNNYFAAGPSPDYSTASLVPIGQLPPTGLIEISSDLTGDLTAFVSEGDFRLLPNATINGEASIKLGAGQIAGTLTTLGDRWGFGGNGGNIDIQGTINSGTQNVLLQVNSLDARRVSTGPTGSIKGTGTLSVFNNGGDGGAVDIRTSDFSVTSIYAGSAYTEASGVAADIGIGIVQTSGNLVLNALPSSRGAIALEASDTATIQLKASFETEASLSMRAGSLKIDNPISTKSGDVSLTATTGDVVAASNVAAGRTGIGQVVIVSEKGNVNMLNSASVSASGEAIRIEAPLGDVTSISRLQAARLVVKSGKTVFSNTAVDAVEVVATGNVTINDLDSLTVTDITSTGGAITVAADGQLTLENMVAGSGDISATTGSVGLLAKKLQTINGTIALKANSGTVVVQGTVLVGDTGSPKTKDASLTALAGDVFIDSTSSIVVPDQLILDAAAGRVLTPGRVAGIALDSSGSDYTSAPKVVLSSGGGATANGVVGDGRVTNLRITNGGSGYTTVPQIVIDAPAAGGTQATAIAKVANGALVSVSITNGGSGYKTPPRVRVVSGGGLNATVAAEINGLTSITVAYPPGSKPTSYQVPPLVVISSGDGGVAGPASIGSGGSIQTIAVAQPGGGYTAPPTVHIADSTGAGYGATAYAILTTGVTATTIGTGGTKYGGDATVTFPAPGPGGTTAQGQLSLGLTASSFTSVAIGGSNYATGDLVEAVAGTGARFRYDIAGGLPSLTILDGGRWYTVGDVLYLNGSGGTGLRYTVAAVDAGGRITVGSITAAGSGYANGNVLANFGGSGARYEVTASAGAITGLKLLQPGSGYTNRPTTLIGGSGINASIVFSDADYQVVGVTVVDPGSGYAASTVTPTFSTTTGISATATGQTTSIVGAIAVSAGGQNYNPATTTITLTSTGSGGGATSSAVSTDGLGAIRSINLAAGGTGYVTAPTVTVIDDSGIGFGATAVANWNPVTQVATGFTITSAGYRYNPATTRVVVTPVGTGAIAEANLTGGVLSIGVLAGGSGYNLASPVVTVAAPAAGGAAAMATANVDASGAIIGIDITNPGYGYAAGETPAVTISGGNGDAIASTGVVGNVVGSVRITNSGSDYSPTARPTITFIPYGSGATASAGITVGGITGYVVDLPGSGYLDAPEITVTGDGVGAEAVATVVAGAVASVRPKSGTFGTDYTVANVAVTGSGSGASVSALISGVTSVDVTSPGAGYVAPPQVIFDSPAAGGATATGTAEVAGVAQLAAGRLMWRALEKPLNAVFDQFSIAAIDITGSGDLDIVRASGDLTLEGATTKDGSISVSAQKLTVTGPVIAGDYNNTKSETVSLASLGNDLVIDAAVTAPSAVVLAANAGAITSSNAASAGLVATKNLVLSSLNGATVKTKVETVRGIASATGAAITVNEADDITLGTADGDLVSNNGVVSVTAGGAISVSRVDAGVSGSVVLKAATNILDATGDATADIVASSTSLTATAGKIDIDTDVSVLSASSPLSSIEIDNRRITELALQTVTARNDIRVATDGGMTAATVNSTLGNVQLTAGGDLLVDAISAVSGRVTLEAAGRVGSSDPLATKANVTATGARITSASTINLRTAVGSLGAQAPGAITIVEDDAITLGEPNGPAQYKQVISTGGNVNVTAGGTISAVDVQAPAASAGITLTSTTGGVVLGSVAANRGSGTVAITAKQSITDNDPAVDLTAASTTLTSTDGSIGSAADAIDLDVSTLRATAYRDIRFNNPAATPLTIAGLVTAGGDVVGSVGGVVSQTGDITAYGFVSSVTNLINGSGYSAATPPTVTVSTPQIPGGRTATATASVDALGRVTAITIADGGSGYLVAPTVTITAPASGTQARATAVLSGGSVRLTAAGGMTQSGGAIKAATLAVSSTSGALALMNPSNDVDSVSLATGLGDVAFIDADGFTVAAPGVTAGGSPAGDGFVTLTAVTGNITLAANVSAVNDGVTLNASKGLIIPAGGSIDAKTFVWFAQGDAPNPLFPGTYTIIGPNRTDAGPLKITSTADPLVIAGATTVDGNITITAPSVRVVDVIRTSTAGNSVTVNASSGDITFAVNGKRSIVTDAGPISLTATNGVVVDVMPTNTSVAGGPLTIAAKSVDLKTNVSSVTSTTTAGPVILTATNSLTLGAIQAAGQTVTLAAATGITQPTGSITAKDLTVTNTTGAVTLTSPSNNVTNVSIVDGDGTVSFVNSGTFSVVPPGISTGTPQTGDGDVWLKSVSGGIAINANIAAPGDRVTLEARNGAISQSAGTAIDSTSLVWYAKSAPNLTGTFTIVGPNLTSAGSLVLGPYAIPVIVAGASTVDGDITITAPDVVITDPVIAGGSSRSITVTATNGGIGVQSKGLLQTAGGLVSLSATGAITAANAGTYTTVTGSELAVSSGSAAVLSANSTSLGNVSMSGPLTLTAKGTLTQKPSATIQAAALDITGAGSAITLANAGNNVGTLSVRNGTGAFSYRDTNELVIDTILAGSVTLSVGTPIVSGPSLSQTASGSITATSLNITSAARGVQLTNSANDVGTLTVSNPGRVVSFTDKNELVIAGITGSTITLDVGAPLTQTGPIVGTSLSVTSRNRGIQLTNPNNDVASLFVSNPGRVVNFTDRNDLSVAGITGGIIGLVVGNNLTQTSPIVGSSLTVTASAGSVTLTNGGNNVPAATITNGTRPVSFTNATALVVGGLTMGAGNLVVGGTLTQSGPIKGTSLGITSSAGSIDLRNAANNLDSLSVSNGGRLFSYADSSSIAITSAGTLSVGTVTAAQQMTVTTNNGGGVDVGPQANGLLQAGGTLDLRAVQGSIGMRNNGRIVGNPILLPPGKGIQIGGAITTVSDLNASIATVNSLPAIPGSTYEILVAASMTLTQQLAVSRPVTFRGTSQSIVLSGTTTVVNGLLLDSGASGSTIRDIAFSSFSGDAIRLTSATGITIKGIRASNSGNGLSINGTSTNTVVQGNTFDRNQTGVSLLSATGALVGGTVTGQGNVISNAVRQGVFASGFCTGSQVVKNSFPGTATPYNVSASRNLTIVN